MEILKQCQIWHESNEYQQIIDTLEALPAGERTPEIDSELARAYNNQADPTKPEGINMLKRAVTLLSLHEEHFQGDHFWNFRMGYAYYYLNRESVALRYFEKAVEARPGDEDSLWFIAACRKQLALPHFEKNFRQRTEEAWAAFEKIEAEIRAFMYMDTNHERGDELIAKCSAVLEIAFEDIAFEIGFNGEKYELILSPEGLRANLFPLVYFQQHAPSSVLEHWNIWVGRLSSCDFTLHANGWDISGEDVQVWTEPRGGDQIALTLYCEKLLPLLQENERKAWWMLSLLTDQVLGDIASIALIYDFDIVHEPKSQPSILLSQLPKAITDMGLSLISDAAAYLEHSYVAYELDPLEDPEADWRLDSYTGSTRLPALINEYTRSENETMDRYHANGVVAGFLCYPIREFSGEERAKQILDFRDNLQAAIEKAVGADAVTFLGGASGLYSGYLDFIAWDLPPVLDAAKAFFAESGLSWAGFRVFRRSVGAVRLWEQEPVPKIDPETSPIAGRD